MYIKIVLLTISIVLFVTSSLAQVKPTTAEDYDGTFRYAVYETNSAYPVIFKFESEKFLNGKSIEKTIETVENAAELHHRSSKQYVEGGKTTEIFEILIGERNTFCKTGNGPWKKSQYSCPGPSGTFTIQMPRTPDTVKYSVEEKKVGSKVVKIYRKYSTFAGGDNGRTTFEDETATIDSNGFFIDVIRTEGLLNPRIITSANKQSWTTKAKFAPIVAPIK